MFVLEGNMSKDVRNVKKQHSSVRYTFFENYFFYFADFLAETWLKNIKYKKKKCGTQLTEHFYYSE